MSRKHLKMLIICSLQKSVPQNNVWLLYVQILNWKLSCAFDKKIEKTKVIWMVLGHIELPEQLHLMWAQILQVLEMSSFFWNIFPRLLFCWETHRQIFLARMVALHLLGWGFNSFHHHHNNHHLHNHHHKHQHHHRFCMFSLCFRGFLRVFWFPLINPKSYNVEWLTPLICLKLSVMYWHFLHW